MDLPEGWSHRSGYYLNADGKAIKYEHEEKSLLAIIEAALNESDEEEAFMEYYTVVFDTDDGEQVVEHHEFFPEQEMARENLKKLMEKHA